MIEASIDHEQGFMRSKENIDIYATKEPQEAFHQRILFCLDLYNQSVKVMSEEKCFEICTYIYIHVILFTDM